MMRVARRLAGLVFAVVVEAALMACSSTIALRSQPPEAHVWHAGHDLGATPLQLDASTLQRDASGGYLFALRKNGVGRVWVWVPGDAAEGAVNIDLQPFLLKSEAAAATTENATRENATREWNQKSADLLKAQTLILTEPNIKEPELRSLIEKNKGMAASLFLEALLDVRTDKRDDAMRKLQGLVESGATEPDYVKLYRDLGGGAADQGAGASRPPAAQDGEAVKKEVKP